MMTDEFPEPGQAQAGQSQGSPSGLAAVNPAELAELRARTVVLRNSRIVCWMTMGMGVLSVGLGICMMLMVYSLLFPLRAITFMRVLAAAQWGLGGFLMCMMLPWAWKWGTRMLSMHVKLDGRGVDLNLGTKKKPVEMFVEWDQLASVEQKRLGKIWEFTITAKDGSWASYTTNTFFRSKRVARMIAERAGLTVQKTGV
jgi:hypothetical protein